MEHGKNRNGTVCANNSELKDMGINIAGKTGTAQESPTKPDHGLFVGYAPVEAPEITVAVRMSMGMVHPMRQRWGGVYWNIVSMSDEGNTGNSSAFWLPCYEIRPFRVLPTAKGRIPCRIYTLVRTLQQVQKSWDELLLCMHFLPKINRQTA